MNLYLLHDSDDDCVTLVHVALPDLNVFTFLDFVTEQEDLVSSEHRAARLIHPRDFQVGGVRRLCNRNRQDAEDHQTESLSVCPAPSQSWKYSSYSVTSKQFYHPNIFKQK